MQSLKQQFYSFRSIYYFDADLDDQTTIYDGHNMTGLLWQKENQNW